MNDDLESQLRSALRPTNPPAGFEQRLLARIATVEKLPAYERRQGSFAHSPKAWWLGAAMAASLLLAVGVQYHRVEQSNREKGLEARRQVIEALQVTNDKLDLAYRAVRNQSRAVDGDPGA